MLKKTTLSLALAAAAGMAVPAQAEEVNVHTIRHHDGHQALFDAFTEQTGIAVNVQEVEFDTLLDGTAAEEGADLARVVDATRFMMVEEAGLFTPTYSALLDARVPEHQRHPEGEWYGTSTRARIFFVNPDEIDPESELTYADLADPRFEGQVCIRSSENFYNQSLLASIIAHEGSEAAEAWAQGVVDNMAREPEGGDTDQIRGVASGDCNIAVANHYYYARLLDSDDAENREAAGNVTPLFPEQGDEGRGTHVNVGGFGVVDGAPNRDNAQRLLEFMVSSPAQRQLVSSSFEYPVVPGVEASETVTSMGDFRADELSIGRVMSNIEEAREIFERVGWQ